MNTFIVMILMLAIIIYILRGVIMLIWTIGAFIYKNIKAFFGHLDTIKKLINGEMK